MGRPPPDRNPVTLVVAAAGYGKTTYLRSERLPDTLHLPAAEVLGAGDRLQRAVRVCVDDLDQVAPAAQHAVLLRLDVLAPVAGIVIASRTPVPAGVRRRLAQPVVERGPRDLALDPYAVAVVLRDHYGVRDPEAGVRVHELTSGWPALVHLLGAELARRPLLDPLLATARAGAAASQWVRDHVLADLEVTSRQLLARASDLGCCTPTLLAALAGWSDGPTSDLVADLERLGVLTAAPSLGDDGPPRLVPVVATALRADRPDTPATVLRAAARALEDNERPAEALSAYAAAGDAHQVHRLLASQGARLVRAGHAEAVARAATAIDVEPDDVVRRLHARALTAAGDPVGALRTLRPLTGAAGPDPWEPALATEVAAVHYLRGELAEALVTLDRAAQPGSAEPGDEARWRSCRAHVLVMLGRRDEARLEARAALRAAEAQDPADASVLATAHLAVATTTTGARKSAHQSEALRAARAADDAVTAARILVNQAYVLLAAARFRDAVPVAREAVRVSEFASRSGRRSAAQHNLAEALMRTGEPDEARWLLERAVAAAQRLGPERCATGLLGLADLEREQAHPQAAAVLYEQAVALARASGERQVLVPALAGLAGVLAPAAPGEALALAEEALGLATPSLRPIALAAMGRAALGAGDDEAAAAHTSDAVQAARDAGALDLLAEALELRAAVRAARGDPTAARCDFAEALAIWSAGGAQPAAYRVEVRCARLAGADAASRSRGRAAARGLQRLGVATVDGRPVHEEPTPAAVRVAVLGGFAVTVDGTAVDQRSWRSRQARTLVKILAARRGCPVSRPALCELLWPDDDPARTGHRLSVLLATVRGVLDPAKAWPVDRYVAADRYGVRLDLTRVDLDAQLLLGDAEHAAGLLAAGEEDLAEEALVDIDARYPGDAFVDEPYEAWADALREETRAAWLRSVRRLVTLRRRTGRGGDTLQLLARMLAVDPYDESTHRLLVGTLSRTGRHGEARRAFDRWAGAMRDIEAPTPDPALLVIAL